MRRIFTLIAVCIVACHAAEEKRPTIPGGVTYHFADDSVVAAARELVVARFSSGESGVGALFAGECMCAPGLWRLVSDSGFERPEMRTFTIPNERTGITYNLDGARLTAAADLKSIARFVTDKIGPHPDVRRLTTDEISKFWIVVPFDIEEPLFVVSSGPTQVVLCLKSVPGGYWRIWWIDALSEYDYGQKKGQPNKSARANAHHPSFSAPGGQGMKLRPQFR